MRDRSRGVGGARWQRLAGLATAVALLACEGAEQTPADPVVARVDGKAITRESLDARLWIVLHDLDQARYRKRLEEVTALAQRRLGSGVAPGSAEWEERVKIALMAPVPPRLEIPVGESPIRGPEEAPVTIVEFLDYASGHSRRLQPALARMLEDYSGRVRLAVRNLPLPYHRYARGAAKAALCAGEQGEYWEYHDVLLLEQPDLAPSDLDGYVRRVGLAPGAFERCLNSSRQTRRIDADLMLATALGVTRAGTLFVNGLYLSGRPTRQDLERVIVAELERLGLDAKPTSVDREEGSWGMHEERPLPAFEGEVEIPADLFSEPVALLTLTRGEVETALLDRRGLEAKLEASRGTYSGQRVLRIREVVEGDLFSKLGLQEGDVPIAVNGRFVTVEHNSLFDAFWRGPKVSLLVMRRGLPLAYEVRIGP